MKSYKLLFFIVFIFFGNVAVYSQKEMNHFAFFNKLEIDFNAINTQLKPTQLIFKPLTCSSTISDSNGNLLFYTDNSTIWNKNHQIMLNGTDAGAQFSLATATFGVYRSLSCVIVPKPGAPGKYLVISTGDGSNSYNLNYSEVDMSLDGGNGAVINKNRRIYTGTSTESISAVRQKNSENVWLVSKISLNDIAAFLVTPTGIAPPVISSFDGENINSSRMNDIEFSPDGRKIVLSTLAGVSDFMGVLDFNSDTGVMSNYIQLDAGVYYDADFSPSGRFLYVLKNGSSIMNDSSRLLQYDMDNIGNPPYVVSNLLFLGSTFLGADGKIYVNEPSPKGNRFESRIVVINKPELLGANCDYKKTNIKTLDLIDFRAKYLKSFVLNPSKVETCVNSNTVLYANSMNTINGVTWDFGDGSSASGQNPTHNYAAPGVYQATAVVNTSNGIEHILKTVVVYESAVANPVPEQYACVDPQGSPIDLTQFTPIILGTQSPTDYGVSYFLTLQDANANSSEIDPNVTITHDISYFVRVYNKNDSLQNCPAVTEIKFHAYVKPLLAIQDKYFLCENSSVVLNSASGFDHYLWSTGAQTESITVTSPGMYSVTVKDDHPNVSCEATKDIEVVSSNKATIVSINISDFTAGNNSFLVLVSGSGDYQYSMDGVHYQDSNAFGGLGSGEFTVYVKDKNGCGISQESVFLLSYPSFFTPNGDGFNDVWTIKDSYTDPDLTISIFDRYGKLIKILSGVDLSWNGTLNGAPLPSTDYWFVAKRGNGKTVKGHFSLKR